MPSYFSTSTSTSTSTSFLFSRRIFFHRQSSSSFRSDQIRPEHHCNAAIGTRAQFKSLHSKSMSIQTIRNPIQFNPILNFVRVIKTRVSDRNSIAQRRSFGGKNQSPPYSLVGGIFAICTQVSLLACLLFISSFPSCPPERPFFSCILLYTSYGRGCRTQTRGKTRPSKPW